VEELAEVLAIDFNSSGAPKLKADWRWEDNEEAVLSACSSLVAVVMDGDSRVVQFSHFSVKEYLTSTRLANSRGEEARFHIRLESAHKVLAQASLGVLLRLDERIDHDSIAGFPLARYAAKHWIDHVKFENVLFHVKDGIDHLFDADKAHFAACVWLYDPEGFSNSESSPTQPGVCPLHYTIRIGGHRALVEHVLSKRPQDLNAKGGYHGTPLHVAIFKKDFGIVYLLLENGADVNIRDHNDQTPLHDASLYGFCDLVQLLLSHDVDVDARHKYRRTPLHLAVTFNRVEVAKILLEHKADVNASDVDGDAPLHLAAKRGHLEVTRLLLEYGGNANARNNKGRTPFNLAKARKHTEKSDIGKVLWEHMKE